MTVTVKSVLNTSESVVVTWTADPGAVKYGLSVWKYPYGSDRYLVWGNYVTGTSRSIGTLPAGRYRVIMKPYYPVGGGPVSMAAVDFSAVSPAHLANTGSVELAGMPYLVGGDVSGSFTATNTGGQSGTWIPLIMALRGPAGENRDAVAAASITLAPGQSQTVYRSRTLDLAGDWTGFVSGKLADTVWQSIAGGAVAFSVQRSRVKLSNPVAPPIMYRSKDYWVRGKLTPAHIAGTYAVLIYRWRWVSGKWKSYGFVRAAAAAGDELTSTVCTRYMHPPLKGKWRLRAFAPADNNHLATWSCGFDSVTVR